MKDYQIKKLSLMEDKNDLYQKQAQEYLKKRVIKSALDTYTGTKVEDKEVRKFVTYLDRFVRQTTSKNDINYRISSLYNHIVSKYTDYIEINQIVLDEN